MFQESDAFFGIVEVNSRQADKKSKLQKFIKIR